LPLNGADLHNEAIIKTAGGDVEGRGWSLRFRSFRMGSEKKGRKGVGGLVFESYPLPITVLAPLLSLQSECAQ
jgi:hypothetical protein